MNIKWFKRTGTTIIPTKRPEDAAYDVYASQNIVLMPGKVTMVPTGLSYYTEDTWFLARDRGSTGSIGLHTYCGVLDAGYRGEIFIALYNSTNKICFITDDVKKVMYDNENGFVYYPITKGIAQLIPMELQNPETAEVDSAAWDKLLANDPMVRGEGKLGASGK